MKPVFDVTKKCLYSHPKNSSQLMGFELRKCIDLELRKRNFRYDHLLFNCQNYFQKKNLSTEDIYGLEMFALQCFHGITNH